MSDSDCGGGNGILWFVGQGAKDIANGSIANCGKAKFPTGLKATVTAGEFLYFIVDANGEFSYDQTHLDVTITAAPAGSTNTGTTTTTTTPTVKNEVSTSVSTTMPDYVTRKWVSFDMAHDLVDVKRMNVDWKFDPRGIEDIPDSLGNVDPYQVVATSPKAGTKISSTLAKPLVVRLSYWDPTLDQKPGTCPYNTPQALPSGGSYTLSETLEAIPLYPQAGYKTGALGLLEKLGCSFHIAGTVEAACDSSFLGVRKAIVSGRGNRRQFQLTVQKPKCADFWSSRTSWPKATRATASGSAATTSADAAGPDTNGNLTYFPERKGGWTQKGVFTNTFIQRVYERATGKVVQNAKVEFLDADGKVLKTDTTDMHGDAHIFIGDVITHPGTYRLRISALSLETFEPIVVVDRKKRDWTSLDGNIYTWVDGEYRVKAPATLWKDVLGDANAAHLKGATPALMSFGNGVTDGPLSYPKLVSQPSSLITDGGSTMVAAGAGNMVAAGAGNLVVSGLIGQDGATLIGQDGATLVGNDGSSFVNAKGASVVEIRGQSLLAGPKGVANGTTMVAAGAGNVMPRPGAGVISDNGSG